MYEFANTFFELSVYELTEYLVQKEVSVSIL